MIAQLIVYMTIFVIAINSFPGDGWMRPMEKDINPNCWKCEPSPEELDECDKNLLTNGRKCGILQSRFVERGNHCIVEILNCHSKISNVYQSEASFIVARGRLIDSTDNNNTSLRYFPLNNPVEMREVIITCTLNGIWQAVLSNTDNQVEVYEVQCITSDHQTMNHIAAHNNEIYR
ncbi:unnamed protein product [Brugia timori]|uniref:Venom protein n=1 Tax=Brugia timori TaxID=42155 RepID=A0A0R3QZ29_9BILA|nr:unnamed protein product [Brugia timori]